MTIGTGCPWNGAETMRLELQVDALLRLQNFDNGMWHTILNDPESYVETSATAGFVAGIFMGLRLVGRPIGEDGTS